MTVFDGLGQGRDDRPAPFNKGGDASPDIEGALLVAALTRLLFEGGTDSIRLELFTGDQVGALPVLKINEVLADKRIPAGDNNAVFILSKNGNDALMTALANGQTLIVRVTRGTG